MVAVAVGFPCPSRQTGIPFNPFSATRRENDGGIVAESLDVSTAQPKQGRKRKSARPGVVLIDR